MAKGFSGMGGGMNMNMMKQVQKMQQDMLRTQEELEAKEYAASSGGGAVTAVISGKKQLVSLKIKPEAVDPDDVEMLEDLVMTAINQALTQASEDMAKSMGRFTGGMNLGF